MGGESNSTSPALMRFGDIRGFDFEVEVYSHTGYYYYNRSYETQYNYPISTKVESSSLVGVMRSKTGLTTIDLPTEAQWEYGAKALSTTALGDGNSIASKSMNLIGRYNGNRNDGKGDAGSITFTSVGSYQPNAWGLYDMHGNVREWCLDAWKDDLGVASNIDPIGNTSLTIINSGTYCWSSVRVVKGGGYYRWHSAGAEYRSTTDGVSDTEASVEACRSSYRGRGYSSTAGYGGEIRDGVAYYTYEGVRLVFAEK